MKHFYLLLISFFTISFLQAQIVNIPDANFKNALLNYSPTIDTNGDMEIQVSEALAFDGVLDLNNKSINIITGLDAFVNITGLDVGINNLTSIDVSPLVNLELINVIHNDLTTIDLSNNINLREFTCNFNAFTSLDFSNNINLEILSTAYSYSLTALNISNCINLERLFITNSPLTSIDLTPFTNLQLFICDNAPLVNLDLSQNLNLRNLSITGTSITNLDLSQNNLLQIIYIDDTLMDTLDVSDNPLIGFVNTEDCANLTYINLKNGSDLITPQNFTISNCPNLEFICIDDVASENSLVQNALNTGGYTDVVVNDYCSFVPGGTFYSLQGESKLDINNNGCDVDDIMFPYIKFSVTDNINTGTFISDTSGAYSLPVQAGTHTLTPILENPSYYNVSPTSISINFPTEATPYLQDFCITPNGVHNDLEIFLMSLDIPRAGFDVGYLLIFRNKGNTPISGTVDLTFDENVMDVLTYNPIPDSQVTNMLSWNYNDLLPFENRAIDVMVNLNAPTDPNFPLNGGDIITFEASISPTAGDDNPEDNQFVLNQTVVNSFDPNDKTCLEGDTITPDKVGEFVHYMIRFENTGTASAINIVVKDVIDSNKFDVSTLIPLYASHNFVTRIQNTNEVEFIFENIDLPFDDATNDGYVVFKIKTLPSLTLGDTFSNDAEIYFDYNAPIVTNDFLTTVDESLSVGQLDLNTNVKLYPNPASNQMVVESTAGIQSITFYDVNGRLLQSISFTEHSMRQTIDVSSLSNGVYFMKIKSETLETIKKFVKD